MLYTILHDIFQCRKTQQQEKERSKIYDDAELAMKQERNRLQEKVKKKNKQNGSNTTVKNPQINYLNYTTIYSTISLTIEIVNYHLKLYLHKVTLNYAIILFTLRIRCLVTLTT